MTSKNNLLALIAFLVVFISIIAGVILVSQKQIFTEKAAPTTDLSFSPSSITVLKGQTFTNNIKVSTGTNLVTGIDIEVKYNPAVIQLTQIVPTSALVSFTNVSSGQVIKNEINNTTGTARFIAYTIDKNKGVSGQQNILALTGNILSSAAPAIYQISYSNLTSIAALNENQNAILSKSPLSITVVSPTASPTMSPIPTPTPSPTPTKSPSPTPIIIPTSVATVTPTASSIVYPNWDVDRNGFINIVDIGLVVSDYENPNPVTPRADVDKNGTINIIDIGIIVDHYQ